MIITDIYILSKWKMKTSKRLFKYRTESKKKP